MSKKTEKLQEQAQAAYNMGNHELARRCYEKILEKEPRHLDARYLLGTLLAEHARYPEAQAHLEAAARHAPGSPFIQNNLGNLYLLTGQGLRAEQAYRNALKAAPDMAEAFTNLGNLLVGRGALSDAIAAAKRAVAARPDMFAAHVMLGNAYKDQGQIAPALEHYGRAQEIAPGNGVAESNLLMTMNYESSATTRDICDAHVRWAGRFPAALARPAMPRTGKLRIGYVSPDLGRHPVGYLMEGVLAAHDRHRFEIFIYSDTPNEDDVSERLRAHADTWRHLTGKSDDQAAAVVATDRIDVLVDLAGHSAHNRLGMMARRVAPVQVSYLGYPATTGLPAMDYALSDFGLDPTDADATVYSEKLWRLDRPSFAFRPDADFPAVDALPAATNGHLTFGSFNTLAKVSEPVLELWADVLQALPDSRLLMQARALSDADTRARISAYLESRGVASERVEMLGFTPHEAHLALFNRVDVCLDTFPWNGHMTTLDSLWMGVPVLTLAGDRRAARMGASILGALELDSLIATTPADFVSKAVALDADRSSLATLRAGLRERIGNSPLADGAGLARALEAAYTAMHEAALGAKV